MKTKAFATSALSAILLVSAATPTFAHPLRAPQSIESSMDQRKAAALKKSLSAELKREQAELAITTETLKILDKGDNTDIQLGLLTAVGAIIGLGGAYIDRQLQGQADATRSLYYDQEMTELAEKVTNRIRDIAAPGHEFTPPTYGFGGGELINWKTVPAENRKAVLAYVESLASDLGEEKFAKLVTYTSDPNLYQELFRVPGSSAIGKTEQVMAKVESRAARLESRGGRIGTVAVIAGIATLAMGGIVAKMYPTEAQNNVDDINELISLGKNDEADKLVEKHKYEYLAHINRIAELTAQLNALK